MALSDWNDFACFGRSAPRRRPANLWGHQPVPPAGAYIRWCEKEKKKHKAKERRKKNNSRRKMHQAALKNCERGHKTVINP